MGLLCVTSTGMLQRDTDEMSESHCSSATEHSMRIDLKVWQETKFAGFVVCKISRC